MRGLDSSQILPESWRVIGTIGDEAAPACGTVGGGGAGSGGVGGAATALVAMPPPRRPCQKKSARRFPAEQNKIGAPTPKNENLTENTVFRNLPILLVFEELRKNGYQTRILRENLRI